MGTNYLISIAVDKYKKGINSLNNAVRDTKTLRKCLIKNYQFEKENCYELYNGDATQSSVVSLFSKLKEKIKKKDCLTINFSGHGIPESTTAMGSWMLSDAVGGQETTYFSNERVKHFIRNLDALHVVAIVDSCFSGLLYKNHDILMTKLHEKPSRYVLTSGQHNEVVVDGIPGKHSPFCQELINQLEACEGEGLWIGDLCNAVRKNVSISAPEFQTPRAEAVQSLGHNGGEYIFLKRGSDLKRLPKSKKSSSPGPENPENGGSIDIKNSHNTIVGSKFETGSGNIHVGNQTQKD